MATRRRGSMILREGKIGRGGEPEGVEERR